MSEEIDKLIAERRKALGHEHGVSDKWGLALSGGGIRSATFSLGLLRALAKNRLLQRFDLLSTVSGGGYTGAMLGRLLNRTSSTAETHMVFDAFGGQSPRWFLWWLRANGRYLVPRGAADRVFALTIFLRNMLAIHLELGALALVLGVFLAVVNVGVWGALAAWLEPDRFEEVRWLSPWMPTLVVTGLPLLVVLTGIATAAYWVVPWVMAAGRSGWHCGHLVVHWTLLATAVLLVVCFWDDIVGRAGLRGESTRTVLLWAAVALSMLWMVAIPWVRFLLRHGYDNPKTSGLREETVRRWLTDQQSLCMKAIALILLAGVVDRVAWFLAFEFATLANVGLGLAVAATVVRAAMPLANSVKPGGAGSRVLLTLCQIAGYVLTFLLCAWWVSLVFSAALGPMYSDTEKVAFNASYPSLCAIGVAAVTYLVFTGSNFEFLNLSSLHTFYRARLVRSYLGAGNPERFGVSQPPLYATEQVNDAHAEATLGNMSVFDPNPGDDLAMEDYAPHRHGGPVHLIGTCINQTRNPRGGLFNRDRYGLPLIVGPRGLVRVEGGKWREMAGRGALSLGSWVAISGAAVAPGLGSASRSGLSALLTFAGVRLGYWWTKAARNNEKKPVFPLMAKSRGLLSETFCNFKGSAGPDWFLTDGGHFENTAAYALLAERTKWIVLADCGADPDYRFGDLENLVRKARIDFGAEIEFLKPRTAMPDSATQPRGLADFGSLNDLASRTSNACLALARVNYVNDDNSGWLVLVKPNLSSKLPVDLVNFAAGNPAFPQQTTADQFFDEAQWESYYQLGYTLGLALEHEFFIALENGYDELFEADVGALDEASARVAHAGLATDRESTQTGAAAAAQAVSRLPARIRSGAVTATISVGAVATVLVSSWQAVNKVFDERAEKRELERTAIKEITDRWTGLPHRNGCDEEEVEIEPKPLTALAGSFVHYADTLCPSGEADWLADSMLVHAVYGDVFERCKAITPLGRSQACKAVVRAGESSSPTAADQELPQFCFRVRGKNPPIPPTYWGYSYAWDAESGKTRHPSDPLAVSQAETDEEERKKLDEACKKRKLGEAPELPTPAPTPGSAFVPTPVVPPAGEVAAPNTDCRGATIYLQIYGPELRDSVREYREKWRVMGASVPPIEDVLASTRAQGRPSPVIVSKTTVRYHDAGSKSCAEKLAGAVGEAEWKVEPLSPSLRSTRGVIEVWVRPKTEPPNQ